VMGRKATWVLAPKADEGLHAGRLIALGMSARMDRGVGGKENQSIS
jgi:hypothetical protein